MWLFHRMRYVSGIRPSGKIHLGNYLGALRHWKAIQAEHDCFWFVADLHGQHSDAEVRETVVALEAIEIQAIPQSWAGGDILRLAHELSFHVPVGWLNRMTQYKDKGTGTLALLSYPVLMAADVLYHGATHVPVGEDQKQHIEFIRDLVDSLAAKGIVYTKPEAVIAPVGARVMSLTDGTKKMSKSDPDDNSRINLSDDADTIARKIKIAKTSMNVSDDTPEANNLRGIYTALGGDKCHTRWSDFKQELTALIVAELEK